MTKKRLSLFFIAVFIGIVFVAPAFAQTPASKEELNSTVSGEGAGLIGLFKESVSVLWEDLTTVQDALNWLFQNTTKGVNVGSGLVNSGNITDPVIEIQADGINSGHLGSNSVGTSEIQDFSITTLDLFLWTRQPKFKLF